MPPSHVMLIRHAEKPSDDPVIAGVSEDGSENKNELAVKGWQRAGALCHFFTLLGPRAAAAGLATPKFLFATAVTRPDASLRPRNTITPLSRVLGCAINADFDLGQESDVAAAALQCDGPVLICWEHRMLPNIAHAIPGATAQLPAGSWPSTRFDVVWLLKPGPSGWVFSQVPQLLLGGDLDQSI